MKTCVTLLFMIIACGDNLPPPPATAAVGHSPESQVVLKGTYHSVVTETPFGIVIAWELSGDGEVYVPFRGIPQGAQVAAFQVVGHATRDPEIAFVDQVQNNAATLPIACDGDLVHANLLTCALSPPGLLLGDPGEFTWLHVTATGVPVTLWSLYWAAESSP